MWESGEAGDEFTRAWISSRASALVSSAEEFLGMATLNSGDDDLLISDTKVGVKDCKSLAH
jgi:hypothetical protein